MPTNHARESLILLQSILFDAKNTKSFYTKMILQENLIGTFCIKFLINSGKINREQSEKLQKQTLGPLTKKFNELIGNDELYKKMDGFVKIRNKITHNLLFKYKNRLQLSTDVIRATCLGEYIIAMLNKMNDLLINKIISEKKIASSASASSQ